MNRDYWLGVATVPALAATAVAIFLAWVWGGIWLDRRLGISFDVKWQRHVDEIPEFRLRRDIWWERAFGPVFAGGWYRENRGPEFTRWLGIGSVHGPCLVVYRKLVRS